MKHFVRAPSSDESDDVGVDFGSHIGGKETEICSKEGDTVLQSLNLVRNLIDVSGSQRGGGRCVVST